MRILIETIPHEQQRYPTVGDWTLTQDWHGNGLEINIKVSKLSNWRHEALVAIHELAEVLACHHDGVTQAAVDVFDQDYERKRAEGDDSEPGDCPSAPYAKQHCIATGIERIMAAALGVSWKDYEDELNSLP